MPLFESKQYYNAQNMLLLKELSTESSVARTKVHRDLIVDDNAINRFILGKYLKRLNVESDTASNGYEAVKLARLYDYDIIWMDIKMAICDGLTATYFLRHNCQYTGKIYGTTGYADEATRKQALECGMTDVLTKPFDASSIVGARSGI